MKKKLFVIIDAMALAYKAYFAFISRPLSTKKGEPTSAVYGFVTQLLKVLEDHKPDYIAVAFDSKEKTFRHERYEAYKSSREEMPEDMIPQLERIKQIISALKMPLYILPGFEADDIIGTAVKNAEKLSFECLAITPDKDYFQLITDKIKIVRPGKSTDEVIIYDKQKVLDELGFEPKYMVDYLALVGDSSDDIPGVAGIGPKTAIPLIQEFGTIENIYKNLDKISKESVRKKLEANKENAFLSKELATIHTGVPLEFNFEDAKFEKPDFEKLREIFVELEFKSLYSKLLNIYGNSDVVKTKIEDEEIVESRSFNKEDVDYKLISNSKELDELVKLLKKSEQIVFDTETDGLKPFEIKVAGISFCTEPKKAYFIPTIPDSDGVGLFAQSNRTGIPIHEVSKKLKTVFEDKNIKKICQNGKYDIAVLRHQNIFVKNFYFDTMLASYVIDPDQKHNLDDLAQKYLNYKPIPLSDLIGDKKEPSKIFDVDVQILSNYSAEDADITFRLYEKLDDELKRQKLNKVAYDIEFPLVPVLEEMEFEGIRIDPDALQQLSKDLEVLMDNYTQRIFQLAGTNFNINSTKQLQEILFEKLKLSTGRKTKTGFSTDARSLENLRGEHEIIDLILNYRQVAKLKSTYTDSLPNLINPKTGRIHTSFNQTGASTGRLSSNDPNLQNIPIRTDLGKEIRKAFVPRDKNHLILSADYSQIELRIMASICEDETLMEAFRKGEDIHRSTAALVFNVKPEEVTADMRRKAKEVNFGILYGIGPFGLKTRLGISQTHAKEIIDTYFRTFKKVKDFMDNSILFAKEKGYAETLYGRRRYLKNINSSNRVVRQFEERVAINMPIQGTAADMIKLAMIKIHKELEKRKAKTKMVLQVHDELVFDAHKSEIEDLKPIIKKLMEEAFPLKVPVVADIGVGENWLDAH